MNLTVESQISDAEDRLRSAMLSSNVGVLSELLAPALIFTNHLGQLQGRESVLPPIVQVSSKSNTWFLLSSISWWSTK